MNEQFFTSSVVALEQEPHRFGVLAVTVRAPGGGLTTINLPSFIGNKPLEVGDPISLGHSGRTLNTAFVRGVIIPLPYTGPE